MRKKKKHLRANLSRNFIIKQQSNSEPYIVCQCVRRVHRQRNLLSTAFAHQTPNTTQQNHQFFESLLTRASAEDEKWFQSILKLKLYELYDGITSNNKQHTRLKGSHVSLSLVLNSSSILKSFLEGLMVQAHIPLIVAEISFSHSNLLIKQSKEEKKILLNRRPIG